MKALFKHLSAITQGKPGSVANNTSPSSNNISTPFVSTTLLAVLLGVPQVPLMGGGKVVAQTTASCPAGTTPETIQFQPSDSLPNLTQQFNIGGINTVLSLSESTSNVIDRTESRFDPDVYGGIPGPNLRLNIGPGKPNRADQPGGTGNLAPDGSVATITINFAQPVTLASPLTLLDVDQEGERDNGRFFRDRVAVSAANGNSPVPVNLQALGNFTQVSGNTAFGQTENSFPDQSQGNVSITPQGPVSQISILYTPDTSEPRGQDQTIGLAPFTICAGNIATGSIGDTVYRDNNNNNVQDQGDVGIAGVPVTLNLPGPDGQLGTGDDTTQNTTTNEQGIYTFPNLPAGTYQVTVETPDGLTPTQTQPNPVDLQTGQNIDTVDFGFVPAQIGSIGDTVYRDNNNNNVQDEGDVGIGGVPVTLNLPGPDGQLGTGDDTTQNTTTNDQGIYTFPNLPAGTYRVTVETPDGLTPTQTQPNPVDLQTGQN
ncbi:MAG: SdrD B-like domain-containing protein, partial [Cyanobacteriota bacterium]|nr:SdrD B-like domain-containing protein [Cyanobacteriota bacterium]